MPAMPPHQGGRGAGRPALASFPPAAVSPLPAPLADLQLARAAHDLRNRLQVAVNSLGLIREKVREGDGAAIQALIRAGEESLFGASTLASRLLNACQPARRDPEQINADKFFRLMLPTLRLTAGEGITIVPRLACEGHAVACDFDGLNNALINLVRNARDALNGVGEIRVEVDLRSPVEAVAARHLVAFSVTDAGCGMSPSQLARAGQPFFSTKPAGQGTGIGLASITQFARDNNGHFEIHSALGQGTIASIFLPASPECATSS